MVETEQKKCEICGLPKEICTCEEVARETQGNIAIKTERRRYGKLVTLIEGVDESSVNDMGAFTKKLKTLCACGGTLKNGVIELQGDQKRKVLKELKGMGFSIVE